MGRIGRQRLGNGFDPGRFLASPASLPEFPCKPQRQNRSQDAALVAGRSARRSLGDDSSSFTVNNHS